MRQHAVLYMNQENALMNSLQQASNRKFSPRIAPSSPHILMMEDLADK